VHGQIKSVGIGEDLYVYCAAIDSRARKDGLRCLSCKTLKSTLTIGDGLAKDDEPREAEESSPKQAAHCTFTLLEGPHSGNDFNVLIQMWQEGVNILYASRMICIHKQDTFTGSLQAPGADGRTLALIDG